MVTREPPEIVRRPPTAYQKIGRQEWPAQDRRGVMEELLRTNDIVLISFVEALLRDAGIDAWVADQNMSIIEGSLGVLQRRVMVGSDDLAQARRLMVDAGIGAELKTPKGEK